MAGHIMVGFCFCITGSTCFVFSTRTKGNRQQSRQNCTRHLICIISISVGIFFLPKSSRVNQKIIAAYCCSFCYVWNSNGICSTLYGPGFRCVGYGCGCCWCCIGSVPDSHKKQTPVETGVETKTNCL